MNLLKNIFYFALLLILVIFYIPLILMNRLIIFCCDWIVVLSSELIELLINTIERIAEKIKIKMNEDFLSNIDDWFVKLDCNLKKVKKWLNHN